LVGTFSLLQTVGRPNTVLQHQPDKKFASGGSPNLLRMKSRTGFGRMQANYAAVVSATVVAGSWVAIQRLGRFAPLQQHAHAQVSDLFWKVKKVEVMRMILVRKSKQAS
jgi:hypothetical protein